MKRKGVSFAWRPPMHSVFSPAFVLPLGFAVPATAPAPEALAWCHAMKWPASLTQARAGHERFVWIQAFCESFFAPIIALRMVLLRLSRLRRLEGMGDGLSWGKMYVAVFAMHRSDRLPSR